MPKLSAFIQLTLDGLFADSNGDMGWAHQQDAEANEFAAENASQGGQLLFGRVTYELMASFWPTAQALSSAPVLAERMNNLPKVVFSSTLEHASWHNTELVRGDIIAAVRRLKQQPGPGLAIMGSGSIVRQLTDAGLIDQYQLMINPIALGQGKSLFEGIQRRLELKLTKSRVFGNGNVALWYELKG